MNVYVIQLITAFIGSLGFAMLFNLRSKMLFSGAFGGVISWLVYLVVLHLFGGGIFLSSLIASGVGALYAELLARVFKCPSTVFYIPSVIPLISGSSLFYTMSEAVHSNWDGVRHYGLETLYFTLGIASGIFLVSGILHILFRGIKRKSA